MREGPAPPRQQPRPRQPVVVGLDRRAAGPSRTAAARAGAAGYASAPCCSASSSPPLAGVVAGRSPSSRSRVPGVMPFARRRRSCSSTRGLRPRRGAGSRPRVRRSASSYALHRLDARRRHRRLDRRCRCWRRSFFALLGLGSARCLQRRRLWPLWIARRVGRRSRCGAAAGPSAGCRGDGWPSPSSTPRCADALPCVGTTGVSFLARADRHARWPGCVVARGRPAWSPRRRSRRWRPLRPAAARCWCRGSPRPRAARPPSPPSRATCPATATTSSTTTARSPTTTSTPPSTSPTASRPATRAAPDFVALAGELHGRRPVPRRPDATRHRTASDAIGVPILVGAIVDAGPTTHVLNQGIVWDPARERGTATPSGTRCRSASTSRSAQLILDSLQIGRLRMVGARHGRPAPAGAAAHRRGARSPTRSASTSPTTTGSTTRSTRGAAAADRADQQRDVHPHRPDRPAVRDHPAARDRDRALGGGRRDQRGLRRHRARTATVVASAEPRTQDVLVETVGLEHERHARGTARAVAGRLLVLLTLLGLPRSLVALGRRIVGRRPAARRRPAGPPRHPRDERGQPA